MSLETAIYLDQLVVRHIHTENMHREMSEGGRLQLNNPESAHTAKREPVSDSAPNATCSLTTTIVALPQDTLHLVKHVYKPG